MKTQTVKLVGPTGNVLAVARVAAQEDYFAGAIDLRDLPASLRGLFEEFEEVVNGQMFSYLDAIQERIASLALRAVFEDGAEFLVKDLQVFPSAGDVSFKLAEASAPGRRLA
jgi:hypothetical protein